MRILAFCDYFGPDPTGGSERVALETYRRMVAAGARVLVITTTGGLPPGRRELDGITVEAVRGVDLSNLVGAQLTVGAGVLAAARRCADVISPNVIHAHTIHFWGSLMAARYQQASSLPMVTTAHLAAADHPSAAVRWAVSGYERTFGRYILSRSSRVVAVSQAVRAHLEGLGVTGETIRVVPNGVDHAAFHPGGPATAAIGPVDRPIRVLFLGRLIGNKGPEIALDAGLSLDRRGLLEWLRFAGDGPLLHRLQDRVSATASGRIRLEGVVGDVPSALRCADVVVRPSFSEGMPLAILEAMACGACVVASDIPGNAELIEDGVNGLLFPPGDATALAARLVTLARDPELRAKLAARGMDDSLSYSWDRAAAETTAVLLDAIEESARR